MPAKLSKAEHDKVRRENLAKARQTKLNKLKAKKENIKEKNENTTTYDIDVPEDYTYDYYSYEEGSEEIVVQPKKRPAKPVYEEVEEIQEMPRVQHKSKSKATPKAKAKPKNDRSDEIAELRQLILGMKKQPKRAVKKIPVKRGRGKSNKTTINIVNPSAPKEKEKRDYLGEQLYIKF